MPRPTATIRFARAAAVLGCSSSLVLAGCGSGGPRRAATTHGAPSVCRAAATVLGRVGSWAYTGNNGAPACRVQLRGGTVVDINVDGSPQPYQRLERTIVEDGQQFASQREFSPPESVTGVGLDAAWIPDLSQVITANQRVLVTVTVHRPHAPATTRRALGIRLARTYLAGG